MIFNEKIKSRKKSRIRNYMRGYLLLQKVDNLSFMVELKNQIASTPLKNVNESNLFWGSGNNDREIILRQFIVKKFLNVNFNSKVLESIGNKTFKISVALPTEWLQVLEYYGFQSNTLSNRLMWRFVSIFYFAQGFLYGFYILINAFFTKDDRNYTNEINYAYFSTLTTKNLPDSSIKTSTVIDWFVENYQLLSKIQSIYHSVGSAPPLFSKNKKIQYVKSPVIELSNINEIFFFTLKFIFLFLRSIFYIILFKKYWYGLMFKESLISLKFREKKQYNKNNIFLFNNVDYLYKPIWTYDAEKAGSKVLMYFYSTNIEHIKYNNIYKLQPYNWHLMNWNDYIVWDSYQKEFIERNVGNGKNITISGPIDFEDSLEVIQSLTSNSILIFDIQPHRESRSFLYDTHYDYVSPNVVNMFLSDICKVAKYYDKKCFLKQKRDIGKLLNKKYKNHIKDLILNNSITPLSYNISAKKYMEYAGLIISFPYTSTALIGIELGKPSIYYDPIGLLDKDDRGAHGIPIISGIDELYAWVKAHTFLKQSNNKNN